MNEHSCKSHFLVFDKSIQRNSKKVSTVLWITLFTMAFEIYYGYKSGSMSLLADGWHMATHAAALAITYVTYRLATHEKMAKNFNFGGGKIIALGGFTSSLFLLVVIAIIGYEALARLIHPIDINYDEALFVAILGLVINVICAYILRDTHGHTHSHDTHSHDTHSHDAHSHDAHSTHSHSAHDTHDTHDTHSHGAHSHGAHDTHGHSPAHHSRENKPAPYGNDHDHNIRGAYLHVMADAFTSVAALIALLTGKYFGLSFLDPIIGLLGALVILKWSIGLIRDTGWELLDGHASGLDYQKLKSRIEKQATIVDLHVWRIAPQILACELIVKARPKLGLDHYRNILVNEFHIQHTVIEERDGAH